MDLKKALSAIKAAIICGIFSSAITLIATAIGIYKGEVEFEGMHFNALMLIDVGLLVGLTVGLFFKSRVCAVLMLVYFVLSKWMQWSQQISVASIIVGVAFLYFYFQGALGTFAYHKLKKLEANQPPGPTVSSRGST